MKIIPRLIPLLFAGAILARAAAPDPAPPNILFIAIDDLNDWIGALHTHPLVKTPNIDALASRGTLFANAHCQASLCNPSRTSVMTGLRPSTTGIHGLSPWFRDVPEWADFVTLPQYFAQHGYHTYSAGKIYHTWREARPQDRYIEFDETGPHGGVGSYPPHKLVGKTPMGNNFMMDWGVWPLDNDDSSKGDYKVATWAADKLSKMPGDQPFFLAVGFFLPHVPCFATQKWFDLYPADDSILPKIPDDDRNDVPRSAGWLDWRLAAPRLSWLRAHHEHINLVRSYLACTSFVDSQVGRVLAALDASKLAENTIVVLWSDNGYHLGEKQVTGKNTLWQRSTHVPLIMAGPGVAPAQVCDSPAELLDIYPTLIDLCGLPPRTGLEGLSLRPQCVDATSLRARPAITSSNQGNYSIVSRKWHYIRYVDGAEELYDRQADPDELTNLAGVRPAAIHEMKRWLPTIDRGPAPGSAKRILTFYDGVPVWEGTPIKPHDPMPGLSPEP